jgi:hypothetical protein
MYAVRRELTDLQPFTEYEILVPNDDPEVPRNQSQSQRSQAETQLPVCPMSSLSSPANPDSGPIKHSTAMILAVRREFHSFRIVARY